MTTYTEKHKEYYEQNKDYIIKRNYQTSLEWMKTPKGIFSVQKRKAKQRKIGWELSFDDWWSIWQESGHWESRGRNADDYCMCRIGDKGSYKVGNVFIAKNRQNSKDSYLAQEIDSLGRITGKKHDKD